MKFTGYVTTRYNSTRVPLKVVQKVGKRTLVDRVIRCLTGAVDDILVYGDCPSVQEFITSDNYRFVQRPIELSGDDVTFEQILDSALPHLDTDYIVFMTCTAPFFTTDSVNTMIDKIVQDGYDSAFAAVEHKAFTWIGGMPIYSGVPKTQDLAPILFETSNIYIFSKDYYIKSKRRIGRNPYIHIVDKIEGWDIDTKEDLEIARRIYE